MIIEFSETLSLLDVGYLYTPEIAQAYKKHLVKLGIFTLKQWEIAVFSVGPEKRFVARSIFNKNEYLKLCQFFKVKERRGRSQVLSRKAKCFYYARYGAKNVRLFYKRDPEGIDIDSIRTVLATDIFLQIRKILKNAGHRKRNDYRKLLQKKKSWAL